MRNYNNKDRNTNKTSEKKPKRRQHKKMWFNCAEIIKIELAEVFKRFPEN